MDEVCYPFGREHREAQAVRRREFMTLLGGAAVWPLAARAQQPAMPVVGLLGTDSPESFVSRLTAIREGLKEVGYFEGQNVAIEYRWAEGHYDRIPGLVADLLRRRVAVIAADGTPAARAAQASPTTWPASLMPNAISLMAKGSSRVVKV